MSSDNPIHASRLQPMPGEIARTQRTAQNTTIQQQIALAEGQQKLEDLGEEATFNPFAMARKFETLESKSRKKAGEEGSEKTQKEEKKHKQAIQKVNEIADQYSKKSNQELQSKTLLFVRERILKGDDANEILRKVLETYPDYSLADEVLDFLLDTSEPDIASTVRQAKEQLNRDYSREIRAGRNINVRAREFAEQGLGSPTALREIYRDITGNPREPNTLFEQLSNNFSFEKMKTVIDFMLHALGADLKSKGPSIARGELHRLMTETRILQAILGVYRFFKSRMRLVNGAFTRRGLVLPSRITFEILAKIYMKFLQERYPTPDKVLQLAIQLGVGEEMAAQVIIFLQFRDASRQIAPRLFRNDQHRLDTLRAFMETLKSLDEDIEEEEQQEESDEKGRKRKKRPKPPPPKM